MSARLLAVGVAGFALAAIGAAAARTAPATPEVGLKPVAAFASITDGNKRSLALFAEVGKVIQSPRCLNCHPAGDRPTQTDAMRPHEPLVVRGAGGMGAPGMRCTTCHHAANFDPAGVPGNPMWHLAPIEMAWQGKSLGEICRQIKDPARNGGKDMAQLIHHMAEDELVGWGWHPGGTRTPAPGTQKQFGELFKAWAESGAVCPS
ncbi:Isoquinoline 1-oxidoreductase subunit [Sphingomonas naphthae]|uniref:Isoquinoline 1-oxidoreductase subunit n=1 Tax=Sphingomonas naphthae TaxID=1813468 RepID=A0ABY7TG96_9SPHN|nr:Isoquinoline 1-oxidoreductase subunit [Sphingomonas naphthae]WCT71955.1 Isoquinoline 1-oxidoreductase subunit [Sphingomonas naphthae]